MAAGPSTMYKLASERTQSHDSFTSGATRFREPVPVHQEAKWGAPQRFDQQFLATEKLTWIANRQAQSSIRDLTIRLREDILFGVWCSSLHGQVGLGPR
jgi:hypothetical protein